MLCILFVFASGNLIKMYSWHSSYAKLNSRIALWVVEKFKYQHLNLVMPETHIKYELEESLLTEFSTLIKTNR